METKPYRQWGSKILLVYIVYLMARVADPVAVKTGSERQDKSNLDLTLEQRNRIHQMMSTLSIFRDLKSQ